ncbi:MAG: flagellar type III secretion system protein FliR [Alphaproteobacteria bacterium]|nr:flagellar type III secretion system protein FliR [Alphaproteobacteria bacterium SS10]
MLEILDQIISGSLFAFMLIFVRFGAAIFLIPGLGDTTVPARVRLLLALAIALILTPVLQDRLPPQPQTVDMLAILIFSEIIIGALFGTVMRLVLTSLEVTGQIIALNIGLANAFLFNPMFNSQSSLPAAMLATTGLTLLFTSDLHHLMFMALADTYNVFEPGAPLPVGDMADLVRRKTMDSFALGAQLAAPFIIITLLFFLSLGVVARVMPQMQIFFVALPIQQLGGIIMLLLGVSAIMMVWLTYADNEVAMFLNGP